MDGLQKLGLTVNVDIDDRSDCRRDRMPTQAEIARDWKTSRVYVHKCVRKGCPVDCYESARAWRDAYARQAAVRSSAWLDPLRSMSIDVDLTVYIT